MSYSFYVCALSCLYVFFFKQKTAYEMRISDWSSDVCSSDLGDRDAVVSAGQRHRQRRGVAVAVLVGQRIGEDVGQRRAGSERVDRGLPGEIGRASWRERVCQYV